MKSNLFAGMTGINTKTIEIDGKSVVLVSAMGPQKMIATTVKNALREGTLDPANIFAAGISRDGTKLHVAIAYVSGNGDAIGDTPVTLTKAQAAQLHLADYDYFSFIATMQDGVNVAALDERFLPNGENGKAFGNFASAVLDGDGEKIRGAHTKTRTLLLLARSGKRTLVACRWGKNGPLTILQTPADSGAQEFGVVGGHTVLAMLPDGGRIYATNVTEISRLFVEGIVPTWNQQEMAGYTIEGISLPVDDTQTVIVTASKDGKRQFIPATVRWDKTESGYGNFRFQLSVKDAIETIELGGWTPAPLRISAQTDIVVGRDNNGGANLLGVRTVKGYSKSDRFARLVKDASEGVYAAAA